MARKRIVVDRESVVLYMGMTKDDQVYTLSSSDIQRIQIDECREFSWFRRVPSEKITIFTSKASRSFAFTKGKNREYYEEYKKSLAEFAKKNYVTFQS